MNEKFIHHRNLPSIVSLFSRKECSARFNTFTIRIVFRKNAQRSVSTSRFLNLFTTERILNFKRIFCAWQKIWRWIIRFKMFFTTLDKTAFTLYILFLILLGLFLYRSLMTTHYSANLVLPHSETKNFWLDSHSNITLMDTKWRGVVYVGYGRDKLASFSEFYSNAWFTVA